MSGPELSRPIDERQITAKPIAIEAGGPSSAQARRPIFVKVSVFGAKL